MFLNSKGRFVWSWDKKEASLCPECSSPLVAKYCELRKSHWAHYPRSGNKIACHWEESEWHLAWKETYLYNTTTWKIEVPIQIGGRKFIIDAYRERSMECIEFVHSLSPYYIAKHRALKSSGYKVKWIFDYAHFKSKLANRMLKPKPDIIASNLGALLHSPEDIGIFVRDYRNHWKRSKNPRDEEMAKDFNRLILFKSPKSTTSPTL